MRYCFILVLVLVTLAFARPADVEQTRPPLIPTSFISTISFFFPGMGNALKRTPGPMLYSLPQKMMQISTTIDVLGFPLNYIITAIGDNSSTTINGVCNMGMGAGFKDLFSWVTLPKAKFLGYVTVQNKSCARWTIKHPNGVELWLDASNNDPVQLITSDPSKGNSTFVFLEFKSVARGKVDVRNPPACSIPPAPCPGTGTSIVTPMVRLHGEKEYELAETNAADVVGDTFFICAALLTGKNVTDGSSLVSLFNIEMYSIYGRYSFCNFYSCLFGSDTLVGRETTSALTGTGQCTFNATLGSWYSLPKAAQCAEGQPLAPGCAWRNKERVKTVAMQCLVKSGLKDACLKDLKFPWANAVGLVAKALNTDLCPDVPPGS